MRSRSVPASSVLVIFLVPSVLCAAGGTAVIATKGQAATVPAAWPAGIAELVNDRSRTSGWNSWFSEWPNDVNQYAFEITTTDDINRLVEKLAKIKSDVRQIRLSHLREPAGLGWATHLPEGNRIAVIFSVGDQARIDEWYRDVRKPFGVMEFTAAPVAVPPTLTIFVQNDLVNLDQIKVPRGITVTSGYVPTVFHRFNTKDEKKWDEETARKTSGTDGREKLTPAEQTAAEKISAFIEKVRRQKDEK